MYREADDLDRSVGDKAFPISSGGLVSELYSSWYSDTDEDPWVANA